MAINLDIDDDDYHGDLSCSVPSRTAIHDSSEIVEAMLRSETVYRSRECSVSSGRLSDDPDVLEPLLMQEDTIIINKARHSAMTLKWN